MVFKGFELNMTFYKPYSVSKNMRVETNGQGEHHYNVILDQDSLEYLMDPGDTSGFKPPKPALKIPLPRNKQLWLFPEHNTSKTFNEHPSKIYFWGYVNSPGASSDQKDQTAFKAYLEERFQEMPLNLRKKDNAGKREIYGSVNIVIELKQP
jgi:hypothetical protein